MDDLLRGVYPGTVPTFKIRRSKMQGWYVLTCQRTGCKRTFIARGRDLLRSVPGYDTRPCPYCFKVSYIRKPKER